MNSILIFTGIGFYIISVIIEGNKLQQISGLDKSGMENQFPYLSVALLLSMPFYKTALIGLLITLGTR